jgi:septal ring factor EnvC (AmiA/AmiB activator)
MTTSLVPAWVCVALVLAAGSVAHAQRHHEPLTQPEIDQIRDASWEPKQRLTLYVQFTRDRLVKLEQMRSDPKTKDRARQTHDMLDDFLLLYDELNDNIDTYVDRKDDIRKPLKVIIEADTEFQAKLRALKDAADVPAEESHQYEFVLTNLLDTVDTSAEDHRKLLVDQEDAAKHKRLNPNSSAKNSAKPE